MTRTKWLICAASKEFTDEAAVRGVDFADKEYSLFIPRSFVRCEHWPSGNEEVPALLQIESLARRNDLWLVKLPGLTFENGSTITVRTDQLTDGSVPEFA